MQDQVKGCTAFMMHLRLSSYIMHTLIPPLYVIMMRGQACMTMTR